MDPIDGNQQTAEVQKEQHTRINEEDEESTIEWAKFEKQREMFKSPAEKASIFDFLFFDFRFLSTLSVKNAYLEELVNDMKRKMKRKSGDNEVELEYSSIAESLTNAFDSSMNNAKTMEKMAEKLKGDADPREYLVLTTFLKEEEKQGHGKFLKIAAIKRRVWFIYDRHGFIDDHKDKK